MSSFKMLKNSMPKDKPIKLTHAYNYFDILARTPNDDSSFCTGETHPTLGAVPANTCYVQPRIQIIDNWGWCNANIDLRPGQTTTGQPVNLSNVATNVWGFYADECQVNNLAYQRYNGVIIVTRD